jgi:sec-independent protein translocase protein TatA
MSTQFLFIGGPEILVIGLIVVMLFGADKIPEIARGLGKGMRQLKDATNDIKKEINETADTQGFDTNIAKVITKEINKLKDEIIGPIKRNR